MEKNDVFSESQNCYNQKFKRELSMVKNYQNQMDFRLSKPKKVQIDELNGRTFKNSDHKI